MVEVWSTVAHALASLGAAEDTEFCAQIKNTESSQEGEDHTRVWGNSVSSLGSLAQVSQSANAAVYDSDKPGQEPQEPRGDPRTTDRINARTSSHSPLRAAVDAHFLRWETDFSRASGAELSLPVPLCASRAQIRAWGNVGESWSSRLACVRSCSRRWRTPEGFDAAAGRAVSLGEGDLLRRSPRWWSCLAVSDAKAAPAISSLVAVPAEFQASGPQDGPCFVSATVQSLQTWQVARASGDAGVDLRLCASVAAKSLSPAVHSVFRGLLASTGRESLVSLRLAGGGKPPLLDLFGWEGVAAIDGDCSAATPYSQTVDTLELSSISGGDRLNAMSATGGKVYVAVESDVAVFTLEDGGRLSQEGDGDPRSLTETARLQSHDRLVWDLHASQNWVLSCSYDRSCQLFDLRQECVATRLVHEASVNACQWTRGGDISCSPLVATGTQSSVCLWDVRWPSQALWQHTVDDAVLEVCLDGQRVVGACYGGHLHAFDTQSSASLSPTTDPHVGDAPSDFVASMPRCSSSAANQMLHQASGAITALLVDATDVVVADASGDLEVLTLVP
jgi:WD40 repeat protein